MSGNKKAAKTAIVAATTLPQHRPDPYFTPLLMQWHHTDNHRQMPWKGESAPYRIWLSEIMLQQTRVEQGWAYYLRFTERFPDIFSLAAATDNEVFKYWEGLGYYSRCRNLLHTARHLVETAQGRFPADYRQLLALKGVGPYTAAAIASFGFGLPHAVVDGNVQRVLARYFNMADAIDSTPGKQRIEQWAQQLLDTTQPAQYNQAIMDFGATLCTPQKPLCPQCPLAACCRAHAAGTTAQVPVKMQKIKKRNRYLAYLLLQQGNKIWVHNSGSSDIWRHLFQFYRLELQDAEALEQLNLTTWQPPAAWHITHTHMYPGVYKQTLTHQQLFIRFFKVQLAGRPPLEGGQWATPGQLKKLAFPVSIRKFLQVNPIF